MGFNFSQYFCNCVGNRIVSCWHCDHEYDITTSIGGANMKNWLIEVMNDYGNMGIMFLIAVKNTPLNTFVN